jgi:glycosyltransferase 2 family protein
MGKIKKVGSIILRVGVSLVLLAFLFSKIDARHVLQAAGRANKPLLFLSFCLLAFVNVICYYRWKMLLSGVGVHPPAKRLLSSFSGGIFFNTFLPSTIGGDFVRSLDLAKGTQKGHEVVATVIMDRLSGYAGMMIVSLLGVIFGIRIIGDNRLMIGIGGLTLALGVILTLLFNDAVYTRVNAMLGSSGAGRIRRTLQRIHEQVYFFRGAKKLLLKNLFLSVCIQLIAPVSAYVIIIAMGLKVDLTYLLCILPVVSTITLLPITTGGLGLRDALNVFFLAKVGIAQNAAFAMSLIGFSFQCIIAVVCGIIYVLTVHSRRV